MHGFSNSARTRRSTGASRGSIALALLLATAALALGGPIPSARAQLATACPNASLFPTNSNLRAVDAATVCLIDNVRRDAHLRPLRPNPSLHGVAAGQSSEMVLGNYFGDNTRSGQTPLQRIVATRYRKRTTRVATAQNIGWGTNSLATPAAIVAAWMASPPHRHIMLTAGFRDVGVGAAPAAPSALSAGQPGATYTVEFGARLHR
ncbi:MAG TPA: CAP domain-containing protein [Solirubrobacteraceae bacterium]